MVGGVLFIAYVAAISNSNKEIAYTVTDATLNNSMPTTGTQDVSIKDATIQITVDAGAIIEVKVNIGSIISVTK